METSVDHKGEPIVELFWRGEAQRLGMALREMAAVLLDGASRG